VAQLLEVDEVAVAYGHLEVLHGVSIEVPAAGAVALLGTNGAGKSTLLRAVAGLLPTTRGSVRLDGIPLDRLAPERRAALGLTLVEGGRSMFPTLSVRDNLRLGAYRLLRRDKAEVERRLADALALFPALPALLDRPALSLSGGEQQMVALARATLADPRLLIIDELSLGLAPVILSDLVDVLAALVDRGVAVLLVEQSLNVAAAVTDTAYFLEKGEVRFSGATTDLLERGDLARSVFFGAAAL
jgi:ABC-type branched-subunit amino acid transport system ATPase component